MNIEIKPEIKPEDLQPEPLFTPTGHYYPFSVHDERYNWGTNEEQEATVEEYLTDIAKPILAEVNINVWPMTFIEYPDGSHTPCDPHISLQPWYDDDPGRARYLIDAIRAGCDEEHEDTVTALTTLRDQISEYIAELQAKIES